MCHLLLCISLLACVISCSSSVSKEEGRSGDRTPESPSVSEESVQNQAKQSRDIFYLVDPKSQMLILTYRYPAGWMTGGKAEWLQINPNMPHHYYTWTASPDGERIAPF